MSEPRMMQMSPVELEREIDRLRATAAWDVKILNAEIDLLRAENAKLKEQIDFLCTDMEKPDYAPARDPSDHLACGGAVG